MTKEDITDNSNFVRRLEGRKAKFTIELSGSPSEIKLTISQEDIGSADGLANVIQALSEGFIFLGCNPVQLVDQLDMIVKELRNKLKQFDV